MVHDAARRAGDRILIGYGRYEGRILALKKRRRGIPGGVPAPEAAGRIRARPGRLRPLRRFSAPAGGVRLWISSASPTARKAPACR